MFPIHRSLFQPPIIVIILVLIFSGGLITSFSTDDTFSDCNKNFTCGSIVNITYPFTGGDRPAFCGPPEFHLSCRNNYPELTISSLVYRVLHINQTLRTLTLARLDLWNNTCPREFFNSTVDFTNFNYGADNVDLTLFYGCTSSAMTINPHSQFKCNMSGNSTDSYYLIGPIPSDPVLQIITCTATITTPILAAASLRIQGNLSSFDNLTSLGEALTEGFNLNYTTPSAAECSMCVFSGGQCGYDPDSSKFACFCGDQLCPTIGKSDVPLGVGLGIAGAGITCLGLGFLFFRYRQRIGGRKFWFRKEIEGDQDVEEFIRKCGSLAPKRYSFSDVKKMTNSFKDKLGQGGFGQVYKGQLHDGRVVAVKVLSESKGNGEEFMNEVASISRTSHVNIVALSGFCYERTKRALIYEFMCNGSLDKFIYDGPDKSIHPLGWEMLYQIALGIARGLEYLHRGCNTRILHFDIKPHNILLDEDFCPKISDFGLAKLCQRKESIISLLGARGTVGYIAPEVFSRNFGGVSHKSDVYSYGMMVLEMVGARNKIENPGSGTSEIYFPHWIYKQLDLGVDLMLDGVMTEEEGEISRKLILVGLWCIQTIPSDRPSMNKAIEMLEGSLQSLQVPPKPFLSSPPRLPWNSSTTSS